MNSSSSNSMVSILLILIPTAVLYVCEAQMITTTSTVDGPCTQKAQHHHPYYPSLHETTFPQDSGAFLFNPSAVEKLEVTLLDPGDGKLPLRHNENHIITQSSLQEENLFAHHGSSIEVLPLPTLFFFRPFENLWSSFVRATTTLYQTVTSTFLTTSYVESTVATSTLFIKKCENSAHSEILLKRLPKCQKGPSTESSPTEPGNSTTMEKCPGTPEKLIANDSFCNQKVDCPFATDEVGCSCRSRLEKYKLCDGIFDCPGGEDEAVCGECNETHFTCDTTNLSSKCISLSQRCDGKDQCDGGLDEALCDTLSPTQKPTENQTIVPKFSSGYVMRNIHGQWYPLCVDSSKDSINIDELKLRICRMAVGNVTIGEIESEIEMINQSEYDGKYAVFNKDPNRPFLVVDQCPTSQLLSVSCPTPLCISRNGPTLKLAILEAKANINSVPTTTSSIGKRQVEKNEMVISTLRIVNGTAANAGAWPWLVAIIQNGTQTCGGALVSSQWMVSAAHCFKEYENDTNFENNYYEVQLSMLRKTSLSPLEQIRAVHRIFLHPEYYLTPEMSQIGDIALFDVKEPFQLNQWAAPLCLPSQDYRPGNGTYCTVAGWGMVKFGGPSSDSLQEVSLPLASCNHFAASLNLTNIEMEDKFICAGFPEGKKDACKGDSGGPLVCQDPHVQGNWIFAGVVNFGYNCSEIGGFPGAYARVTHHLDWINKTMSDLNSETPLKTQTECPGITCQKSLGTCVLCENVCDGVADCFGAEDEVKDQCDKCLKTPSVI